MHSVRASAAALLLAVADRALALDVPSNVQNFYKSATSRSCSKALATGFYGSDGDQAGSVYCGDHTDDYNVIYIKGPGKQLVNMDIDCDGYRPKGGDKRCGSSTDTQDVTSFQSDIKEYNVGISDVNPYIHPYVVFGNEGSKSGWATFNPQDYGIEPLSVMAVVCGGKLFYGVWADTNGDDGDTPVVGEASIGLATMCFGNGVNGNSGHDEADVLYIAFPGSEAVPGAKGAKWNAANSEEFHSSITNLGNKLIQRIKA